MSKLLYLFLCLFLINNIFAQDKTLENAIELAEEGNFEEAVKIVNQVIMTNTPKAEYYLQKADYLLELQKYKEAILTLTSAIQIMPDSLPLYDMRGTLYDAFLMYDEAIADYTVSIEKTNDNSFKAHSLSNRGGTKAKIRNFESAYSDLILAIELDSTNLAALNNLATVCDEINKSDETLYYLEKVVSIDPDFVPAYVNLGFKHQQIGNHEKALQYFDKAIKMAPEEPLAYSNRSFSKLKTNDLKGAMSDINFSLKQMPQNSYAYKIRALIYIEQRKFTQACKDLKLAIEWGYTKQYGDEVQKLQKKYCNISKL